jgi:lysophospholipase L1-like esterase
MNRARLVALAASALAFAGAAMAQAPEARWVVSWASAQMVPAAADALPDQELTGATLRQVVHLSLGGQRLRVRLSNAFGTQPLRIASAHVARAISAGAPQIDPASDRALLFGGKAAIVIPPGAEALSDPVDLPVPALADLAITMRLDGSPGQQTSHPGSRTTSYVARGDQVSAPDLPDARRVERWYDISGVLVEAAAQAASIATLGDSITDGHGATTNANDRWTDVLAGRLQANPATRHVGVVNLGIGGNRLLNDGLGPNALARLDRDVLAQPGVRWLFVLEGVNDLGVLTRDQPVGAPEHAEMVAHVIGAYQQIVARAHAKEVKVIGSTILPYTGSDYYHPDAANEADRQAVNRWIRESGQFDAVVDLDAVVRDPARPDRLRPELDTGDHLHPSPAGFRAMAGAIPLELFGR